MRGAVRAANPSDKVLSGVVYERNHSPSATESPQDQLRIRPQRPVIENRLVYTTGTAGRGAIIKRRIESIAIQTPSAQFERARAGMTANISGAPFWDVILGAGRGTYFLSSCALWLSDMTACAALGHGSTKLLEREGEIIIQ